MHSEYGDLDEFLMKYEKSGQRSRERKPYVRSKKQQTKQLLHAARGTKQVVVKVVRTGKPGSKSRKGLSSVMRLVKYISREGELSLTTRDGEDIADLDKARTFVQQEWQPGFTKRKNGSDVLHMVLSLPKGSDRGLSSAAARNFANDFLEGHDYLAVRHDDTANPHVHLIVKVLGDDGQRLDLRKNDLELARESFAYHAQELGLDVAASRRVIRGNFKQSSRLAKLKRLERSGEVLYQKPMKPGRAVEDAVEHIGKVKSWVTESGEKTPAFKAIIEHEKQVKDIVARQRQNSRNRDK